MSNATMSASEEQKTIHRTLRVEQNKAEEKKKKSKIDTIKAILAFVKGKGKIKSSKARKKALKCMSEMMPSYGASPAISGYFLNTLLKKNPKSWAALLNSAPEEIQQKVFKLSPFKNKIIARGDISDHTLLMFIPPQKQRAMGIIPKKEDPNIRRIQENCYFIFEQSVKIRHVPTMQLFKEELFQMPVNPH